jgi:hypothetical protein
MSAIRNGWRTEYAVSEQREATVKMRRRLHTVAYQIPLEGGERARQSSEPCQVVWNLDVNAVSCAKGGE